MQTEDKRERYYSEISTIRQAIEIITNLQHLEDKLENLQQLTFVVRDIASWILDTLLDGVKYRKDIEYFEQEKKKTLKEYEKLRKNQIIQENRAKSQIGSTNGKGTINE